MTPLTRCDLRRQSTMLLRPFVIVKVLVILAVLSGLALAETHLRFLTRDLQIETRKLQLSREKLINRNRALVSEVEQLKRYDRLRAYAETELGLREPPAGQNSRADLSEEAVARWSGLDPPPGLYGRKQFRPEANLLAMMGKRMVSWSSISLAREPEEKSP